MKVTKNSHSGLSNCTIYMSIRLKKKIPRSQFSNFFAYVFEIGTDEKIKIWLHYMIGLSLRITAACNIYFELL